MPHSSGPDAGAICWAAGRCLSINLRVIREAEKEEGAPVVIRNGGLPRDIRIAHFGRGINSFAKRKDKLGQRRRHVSKAQSLSLVI